MRPMIRPDWLRTTQAPGTRSGAAHFHRVDVEPIEHVVVDDRQLLDRIVDSDRALRKPERLAKLGVSDRGDAR